MNKITKRIIFLTDSHIHHSCSFVICHYVFSISLGSGYWPIPVKEQQYSSWQSFGIRIEKRAIMTWCVRTCRYSSETSWISASRPLNNCLHSFRLYQGFRRMGPRVSIMGNHRGCAKYLLCSFVQQKICRGFCQLYIIISNWNTQALGDCFGFYRQITNYSLLKSSAAFYRSAVWAVGVGRTQ